MKKVVFTSIEVFIITYNRSRFLRDGVQSIANQTLKGIKISILDNGSTDDTTVVARQIVDEYKEADIRYIRIPQNGGYASAFEQVKLLCSKEYVMIFHDDDILHPRYLELAAAAIDKFDNVAVVGSPCTPMSNPSVDNWEEVSSNAIYCEDYVDLAALMYFNVVNFAFPSAIYRSEYLKKSVIRPEFGLVCDKPLVLDAAQSGTSIIFTDKKLLRYRLHDKQSSTEREHWLTYEEIIAHNKYIKDILYKKPLYRIGFWLHCREWIISLYNWGRDFSISQSAFERRTMDSGAGNWLMALLISKLWILRSIGKRIRNFLSSRFRLDLKSVNVEDL
jgi:glycosyltransferase involved in cell wall biosynthesis